MLALWPGGPALTSRSLLGWRWKGMSPSWATSLNTFWSQACSVGRRGAGGGGGRSAGRGGGGVGGGVGWWGWGVQVAVAQQDTLLPRCPSIQTVQGSALGCMGVTVQGKIRRSMWQEGWNAGMRRS